MTALVHITPHFPPQFDGLGDYAHLLACQLKTDHAIETRFVVSDPEWRSAAGANAFAAEALLEKSSDALLRALGDAPCVLLHYVGYGYHSRGVPLWLERGLRRWKNASSSRRLIVVFHELWAAGPPWRSEFYLSPIQRRIVVRLHRLSDAAVTSTPVMKRILEKITSGKTTCQPVASNLPAIPFASRKPQATDGVRIVFFGLEASRLRSVQTHEKLLHALHAEGLLTGVEAVGKSARTGETPSADVKLLRSLVSPGIITASGDVPPGEAAARLAQADLFLSFYPSALVCKSGAFMAALACGCVPVIREAKDAAPLVEGRELLACDGSPASISRLVSLIRSGALGKIAEAGWRWRDQNASWSGAARHIAALLHP